MASGEYQGWPPRQVCGSVSEGKSKGRPASIDAAEIRRLTATMGPAAIAKQLGVARSTVYRLLDRHHHKTLTAAAWPASCAC
jgi:DNA invertase Pin-like site-specific DNA recombinase